MEQLCFSPRICRSVARRATTLPIQSLLPVSSGGSRCRDCWRDGATGKVRSHSQRRPRWDRSKRDRSRSPIDQRRLLDPKIDALCASRVTVETEDVLRDLPSPGNSHDLGGECDDPIAFVHRLAFRAAITQIGSPGMFVRIVYRFRMQQDRIALLVTYPGAFSLIEGFGRAAAVDVGACECRRGQLAHGLSGKATVHSSNTCT